MTCKYCEYCETGRVHPEDLTEQILAGAVRDSTGLSYSGHTDLAYWVVKQGKAFPLRKTEIDTLSHDEMCRYLQAL